jgi:hypothetical protein
MILGVMCVAFVAFVKFAVMLLFSLRWLPRFRSSHVLAAGWLWLVILGGKTRLVCDFICFWLTRLFFFFFFFFCFSGRSSIFGWTLLVANTSTRH